MTNVPAKPKRDSNTVRMNGNHLSETRAQPNVIAVMRHASSRSRRIATAPRQAAEYAQCKEFCGVSFFQSCVPYRQTNICRILGILRASKSAQRLPQAGESLNQR